MNKKEINILFIFLIVWAIIIPLSESLAMELYKDTLKETNIEGQKVLYGIVLSISFLLIFNTLTFILESVRFDSKTKSKRELYSGSTVPFNQLVSDVVIKHKKEIGVIQLNGVFFNYIVLGIFATIILLGFIFGVIPFYLSEQKYIGFKDIIASIFTPLHYMLNSIGSIYINNNPFSRIILLLMLPIASMAYLYGISNIDKYAEKVNEEL